MKTYLPVAIRPIGGINADRAPVALETYESPLSTNILFEAGVARVRPHLLLDSVWALSSVRFAKSFIIDKGATYSQEPYVVFVRPTSLYKWNPYDGTPLQEVTGAGVSFSAVPAFNATLINGNVVVGNRVAGMTYWALGSTTYSTQTDALYRYFTGINSRVVGAFRIEGGNQDPRELGWSVAGDITDWTSDGAGAATLSDLADSITGLRTVDNRVVILRNEGYSFGTQTGQSTPAFRFETPIRKGIGFPYPQSIEEYNNSIFGIGRDDVYELTLSRGPQPIGTKIRKLLMPHLARGISYQGLIVRGDRGARPGQTQSSADSDFVPRTRYHLIPTSFAEDITFDATYAQAPHFSYDFGEGTWAIHTYNFPDRVSTAYEGVTAGAPGAQQSTKLSFLQRDIGDQYDWTEDHNSASEEPAILRSKVIKVGDGQTAFRVHNMLVTWALEGDYTQFNTEDLPTVEVAIYCKSRYQTRVERREIDFAKLAKEGSPDEWYNSWFSMQLSGNLFQVVMTIPAPIRMAIESITFYVSEAGQTVAGVTRDTD